LTSLMNIFKDLKMYLIIYKIQRELISPLEEQRDYQNLKRKTITLKEVATEAKEAMAVAMVVKAATVTEVAQTTKAMVTEVAIKQMVVETDSIHTNKEELQAVAFNNNLEVAMLMTELYL
jgi:hypothetical protein